MDTIKLGDKVKDLITDYTGIAVARVIFINGCVQYIVEKKRKPNEAFGNDSPPSIDSQSLVVIKRNVVSSPEYLNEEELKKAKAMLKKIEEPELENGGPTTFQRRMRGY